MAGDQVTRRAENEAGARDSDDPPGGDVREIQEGANPQRPGSALLLSVHSALLRLPFPPFQTPQQLCSLI